MIVEAKEPLGEDVILFEGEIEEFGRELWKVTKCREPTIAIEYFYSIFLYDNCNQLYLIRFSLSKDVMLLDC